MTLRRVVLLISILLSSLVCDSTTEQKQPEVKGTVTDATGAGVPNALVVFSGNGREISVTAAQDGTYSARLAPGTYDIRVDAVGFCGMRRGDFIAEDDAVIEFDFLLVVCPSDDSSLKWQYAALDPAPGSGLHPLVLYGEASTRDNLTHYTGPEVRDAVLELRTYPTVLTYNFLTIRCRELLYDPMKHLAIGTGEVEVRQGAKKQSADTVRVVLSGREPKVETEHQ